MEDGESRQQEIASAAKKKRKADAPCDLNSRCEELERKCKDLEERVETLTKGAAESRNNAFKHLTNSIGVWLLGSVKAFEEEAEFDSAFFDAVKVEFTREARTRHGMELVGYKTRVLLTELAGWGAQFPERTVDDLSRALEAGDFLGDDGDEYYHDRGYVDDDVKYIAVALGESPPPSDDARDSGEEEDNDEEEQGDDEEGLEEPDEYDLEDSFIAGGRGGDSSSSSSDDDDDNDEDAAARLRRVRGRRVVSSSSSSSSSSASGNEDDDEEPPVGRE